MTTQLTTVDPKQYGLEESKANQMLSGLTPIFEERTILAENYNRVIKQELNDETLKEARELRLKIRDNRTKGIEAWHKVNKEFYLRGGQFVDAIKKKEVLENERMEDNLLSIEKHFENIEKEKQEALHNSRIEQIKPFVDDVTGLDFRTMQQDVFDAFLTAKKSAYEARIEAERKAEAERIESARIEAERIEAQRIENERLKKEAEEREAKAKKEREEFERKQKEIEEKARKEREALELKAKKEREALEEKARQEKAKQDAIIAKQQAELKAKQDAEEKAKKEREALELKAKQDAEKLAKAPIKKQMKVWVDSFALPESLQKNDTSKLIEEKFNAFKNWAIQQVESI